MEGADRSDVLDAGGGDSAGGTFVIEEFDAAKHDREGFSCGVVQVDNYFRKTANKLAKAENVRLYVMVASTGEVAGFYAVNAHAVDYRDLPKKYARTRPRHDSIPAAYISMIGRDVRFRDLQLGADLLVDALMRIARAEIGLAVVMLDVLDCGIPEKVEARKAIYAEFGFQPLDSDPLRMFMPIETARKAVQEESA